MNRIAKKVVRLLNIVLANFPDVIFHPLGEEYVSFIVPYEETDSVYYLLTRAGFVFHTISFVRPFRRFNVQAVMPSFQGLTVTDVRSNSPLCGLMNPAVWMDEVDEAEMQADFEAMEKAYREKTMTDKVIEIFEGEVK